jgi:cytoskeletal protein CcmA (bactofilin family)
MWNKQPQTEVPGMQRTPAPAAPQVAPPATNVMPPARSSAPTARNVSCLGASIEVKGRISGDEDLQIDGKVEGPVSLQNHRLIVGRSAQLNSEISAREIVIHGKVTGNLNARDRVEINKDASVMGDLHTSRIMIEDGAYFKGTIEIKRTSGSASSSSDAELESSLGLVAAKAE